VKEEFSGVLSIKEDVANTALVKEELKVYDAEWDWKVKQCDRDTFTLVFPNKVTQQHFTRLKSFEFSSAIVKAKISASDLLACASLVLKPTWVKVTRVSAEFTEELILKHVCKMVGRPEEVDKNALRGTSPDRVKIKCRKPTTINCSIEFFFGDVGHYINFEGED
jgi:hypothetical protein